MFDWWKRMTHKHHETDNELLRDIKELLIQLVKQGKPHENDGISMSIPKQNGGMNNMPGTANLTVGLGGVQPTVVETLKGVPTSTFNGPLAFAVDNSAFATQDPATGFLTPVAPGTCNSTVTDAVGNLTDTWVVNVSAAAPVLNDGIQMTIPAQSGVTSAARKA